MPWPQSARPYSSPLRENPPRAWATCHWSALSSGLLVPPYPWRCRYQLRWLPVLNLRPVLPTGPPLKSTSTPYPQKDPLAYDPQEGTRTLSQSLFSFIPSSVQSRTCHQKLGDIALTAFIPAPPAIYQSVSTTSVLRTELWARWDSSNIPFYKFTLLAFVPLVQWFANLAVY